MTTVPGMPPAERFVVDGELFEGEADVWQAVADDAAANIDAIGNALRNGLPSKFWEPVGRLGTPNPEDVK